jgi:HPt (histidine-containing phosphotransfer) domain-containing protein
MMKTDDAKVWDRWAAVASMSNDADAAHQLVALLIDSLQPTAEAFSRQLAAQDWDGISQSAHRLLGGCRLCCTPALETLMEALETAAVSHNKVLVIQLIDEFHIQAERLRDLGIT